jgi:4-hydroxy-3-methylbut-2-enyl diphosphate reductase
LKVILAKNYGFCFGVKRAIQIAESSPNSNILGPLIHNPKEIQRLKDNFNINTIDSLENVLDNTPIIIRTHGIPKQDLKLLNEKNIKITDATCPYVKKPQKICEEMEKNGYQVVIFGDKKHPEVKGIMSYVSEPVVVIDKKELDNISLKDKVAIISQTTKDVRDYQQIINEIIIRTQETRVFNTICNATFENQIAAKELAKDVDIMIIIGGKNSSNTKQLVEISKDFCKDSFLVEDIEDLKKEWFRDKEVCGVTAGASTPDWVIKEIIENIKHIKG